METESQVEFEQRWLKTAEADLRSAKRRFHRWTLSFLAVFAGQFFAEHLLPRSSWSMAADLLLIALMVIFLLKFASSASDVGYAKKFLRKCRGGLVNES